MDNQCCAEARVYKRNGAITRHAGRLVRPRSVCESYEAIAIQEENPEIRGAVAIRLMDDAAAIWGEHRLVTENAGRVLYQTARGASSQRHKPEFARNSPGAPHHHKVPAVRRPRGVPKELVCCVTPQDDTQIGAVSSDRGQSISLPGAPRHKTHP